MTPREPRTSPIVPSYGESSLADLSASILASMTGDQARNVLGLPGAGRACLLVVDGLGWELLRGHQAAAPFLSELAFNSRPLTGGFPSTTVTSLGSMGTALPPAAHGMLGYQVAVPGTGRLVNGLHWPTGRRPAGLAAQADAVRAGRRRRHRRHPRRAGRLADSGPDARRAARGAVPRGGLAGGAGRRVGGRPARLRTRAGLRLHRRPGRRGPPVRRRPRRPGPTSSRTWTGWRSRSPRRCHRRRALRDRRPRHGRTSAPRTRWTRTSCPELRAGVALLGGEPRARHVYARPGAAADVLAAWREVLGERAWVASRDEAIRTAGSGRPTIR